MSNLNLADYEITLSIKAATGQNAVAIGDRIVELARSRQIKLAEYSYEDLNEIFGETTLKRVDLVVTTKRRVFPK